LKEFTKKAEGRRGEDKKDFSRGFKAQEKKEKSFIQEMIIVYCNCALLPNLRCSHSASAEVSPDSRHAR
jgi:hypothetical protein